MRDREVHNNTYTHSFGRKYDICRHRHPTCTRTRVSQLRGKAETAVRFVFVGVSVDNNADVWFDSCADGDDIDPILSGNEGWGLRDLVTPRSNKLLLSSLH